MHAILGTRLESTGSGESHQRRDRYDFQSQGSGMEADCFNGRVWRIIYTRLDGTPFTNALIKAFLSRTVPGAEWTEIDYDGVTFFTDVNGKSYGNVSQSSREALEAAI